MSNQESKYRFIESTDEDPVMVLPAKTVTVATFNKNPEVTVRPQEVHVYIAVDGLPDPVAIFLKNPANLAELIRELTAAGRMVWEPPRVTPGIRKRVPVA